MTNFEKLALEGVNTHGITDHKPKKGIWAEQGVMAEQGTGVTFSDSLNSITAQTVGAWTPEGEQPEVPQTWSFKGVWDILGSVRGAEEYLKILGVDTGNRVPTYEITAEQREWLNSRHDFEALKNGSIDTSEFGDLMGDLYYLNIISKEDAMAVARVEAIPDGQAMFSSKSETLIKISDTEQGARDDRADAALKYIKKLLDKEREYLEEQRRQNYLDFINGKTSRRGNAEGCFDLLIHLLDDAQDDEELTLTDDERKRIINAAEKLDEDFSAIPG